MIWIVFQAVALFLLAIVIVVALFTLIFATDEQLKPAVKADILLAEIFCMLAFGENFFSIL